MTLPRHSLPPAPDGKWRFRSRLAFAMLGGIALAFLLQRPTLLTLAMFPVPRRLRGGAAPAGGPREVKIHGDCVKVRAEIASLGSLSAHADRGELLRWIGRLPRTPKRVFLTHGEPVAADSLRLAIEDRHRWPCTVAEHLQAVEL